VIGYFWWIFFEPFSEAERGKPEPVDSEVRYGFRVLQGRNRNYYSVQGDNSCNGTQVLPTLNWFPEQYGKTGSIFLTLLKMTVPVPGNTFFDTGTVRQPRSILGPNEIWIQKTGLIFVFGTGTERNRTRPIFAPYEGDSFGTGSSFFGMVRNIFRYTTETGSLLYRYWIGGKKCFDWRNSFSDLTVSIFSKYWGKKFFVPLSVWRIYALYLLDKGIAVSVTGQLFMKEF